MRARGGKLWKGKKLDNIVEIENKDEYWISRKNGENKKRTWGKWDLKLERRMKNTRFWQNDEKFVV